MYVCFHLWAEKWYFHTLVYNAQKQNKTKDYLLVISNTNNYHHLVLIDTVLTLSTGCMNTRISAILNNTGGKFILRK